MELYYEIFFYTMLTSFIGSCIYLVIDARNYSKTNKNEDK